VEFEFYDELNDTIILDKYITSKDDFTNAVYVHSVVSNDKNKIAEQYDKITFEDPNRMIHGKTWINKHLKIRASPSSQATITFKTSITKYFDTVTKQFVSGSTFNLTINFRGCQSGEYFDKHNNYC